MGKSKKSASKRADDFATSETDKAWYIAESPFAGDPKAKEAFHKKTTRVIWGALTLLCLNLTLVLSLMAWSFDQIAVGFYHLFKVCMLLIGGLYPTDTCNR